MNNKFSYVEPKNAPDGVPCRFCDLPAGADGLGPIYQDGVAVDKKKPLFSHEYCLLNSGGLKQDGHDFSLQSLLPPGFKNHASAPVNNEENIWEFTSKNRFIAAEVVHKPKATTKTPAVQPMMRTDKSEEYQQDGTGASIPPAE
jgi:hypothetical protein